MVKGEKGYASFVDPKSGKINYLVFSPIQSANYSIGLVVPQEQILAPVKNLQLMFIYAFLTAAVFVVFVAFLISRKVSSPIVSLNAMAKEISQGNWSIKLKPEGRDEIRELTESFISMTESLERREYLLKKSEERLEKSNEELQDRVADRTAKLETEVTERLQAMNILAETEEQNRLLLDSAGEGIYGLDVNGKTSFANPAACKMLGYEADELLGQPMHPLVHHSYPDGSPYPGEGCPMYAAVIDGQVHRVENEVLWRKDGSSFPVEYTSTPIVKDAKRVGAVVIFNDISERKKVDQMKEEFISTVNHELRTPLTSIKGSLGLVVGGQVGDLPDKVKSMLKIAYENCDRLSLIINDLLDINKIEAVKASFQKTTIHVNTLIDNAILSNQGYAEKFDVKFQWQPVEDDDVSVSGEENRLIQVLSNLLSNAIKYSPKGAQVVITTNHDNKEVRVSITDSGPGIPLEFQGRVFEKFTQVDSSNTRQVGGTGLGLAITKDIIEGHGGCIGFKSEPGHGSTFYFDLPIVDSELKGSGQDN